MPERLTQRDTGAQRGNGEGRKDAKPLSAHEARLFILVIMLAGAVSDLGLYFKLDIFQHATTDLVNTLHRQNAEEQLKWDEAEKQQNDLLKAVRSAQEKTDMMAEESHKLAQQSVLILGQLREITSDHTRQLEQAQRSARQAASAAVRANINTQRTEKTISKPWYEKIFK